MALESKYLEFSRRVDLGLKPLASEEPSGIPNYYYHDDSNTIGITPTNLASEGYNYLNLIYDGEVPDDLSLDTALPIPAWMEDGLMAYAAALVGAIPMEIGLARFNEIVNRWNNSRTSRERLNTDKRNKYDFTE